MMSGSSCSICLDCFSRPVACIPCGHVFCDKCISQWRNSGRNCPNCRECIRDTQKIISEISDNNVRKSWKDEDFKTKVFTVFIFVLFVSLLIVDVKSEHGFVRGCLLPVFELIFDAACRVSSLLLFILTRPVLCLGRCLGEICCMFSDIFLGLWHTLVTVIKDAIMVPVVIMTFIANIIVLFVSFSAEIALLFLRLFFVVVQCAAIAGVIKAIFRNRNQ